MQKLFLNLSLYLFPLLCLASPFEKALNKPALLSPEEAFVISVFEVKSEEIIIDIQITPGYYLYRDQFSFSSDNNLTISTPILPEGTTKTDEFFGTQQVYEQNTLISIPIEQHKKTALLNVSYRGCAPIGVCYPPIETTLTIDFKNVATIQSEQGEAFDVLAEKHFTLALLIFFGLGLLLAFTPCVLPMLPILSSIILGQKNPSRARAFELSLIYALAVAVTFAIAGVMAALLGASLQNSLQQPAVLIVSAIILAVLAILLLMDYPLQLPHALNNKLNALSQKQKSGTLMGVAGMGILSALVVSPCVTPPLIGALIYIAESGNIALGGGALFMLGLGMGVPLVLFAVFGAHILPKQGAWLRGIKILFAVLLIGLAASLIMRINFESNEPQEIAHTPSFNYTLVKSVEDVAAQIQQANQQGQRVILDFYADWCVSCVKMEKTVFPAPEVQALLKNVRFLKADVTQNDAEDKALLKHFNIYGPPAILFFDLQGSEQKELEIVGEITIPDFINHLKQWQTSTQ